MQLLFDFCLFFPNTPFAFSLLELLRLFIELITYVPILALPLKITLVIQTFCLGVVLLSQTLNANLATLPERPPKVAQSGGNKRPIWQQCMLNVLTLQRQHKPGLFNLLNKWAEKENHLGFIGHTEQNYVNESLQINRT